MKLSIALLGLFSSSLSADYVIYPQGKDIKRIDVPKQSCLSNLSGLENGMYTICGYEGDGEYPVVGGEAFNVESVRAADAFICPEGYASHGQAIREGNRSAVFQYSDYRRTGPGSYYYYNPRGGTQEILLSKTYVTNATSYIYSRDDTKVINTEVANRACVVTPITE